MLTYIAGILSIALALMYGFWELGILAALITIWHEVTNHGK
jgi:hypothetical protein